MSKIVGPTCVTVTDRLKNKEGRTPKELTYKYMDWWVWVMEFTNGEYDEIDGVVIASNVRKAEHAANAKKEETSLAWLTEST